MFRPDPDPSFFNYRSDDLFWNTVPEPIIIFDLFYNTLVFQKKKFMKRCILIKSISQNDIVVLKIWIYRWIEDGVANQDQDPGLRKKIVSGSQFEKTWIHIPVWKNSDPVFEKKIKSGSGFWLSSNPDPVFSWRLDQNPILLEGLQIRVIWTRICNPEWISMCMQLKNSILNIKFRICHLQSAQRIIQIQGYNSWRKVH